MNCQANYIGGIVGANYNAKISNCFNDGNIKTEGFQAIGGIAGCQEGSSALISNCYNKNVVEGAHNIGGIVGTIEDGGVNNCYNIGQISSYLDLSQHDNGILCAGAIAGYNTTDKILVSNCYSLDSLNVEIVGDVVGNPIDEHSSKKTEQEMKSENFVTTINAGENNFKKGSTYPILSWQ